MSCSTQQVQNKADCFLECLNVKQLRAIKALAIQAYGGNGISVQTVIDTAECMSSCLNNETLLAAEAARWVELANAGGAGLPSTPEALANLIEPLNQLGDEGLYGVEVASLCGIT